MKLHYNPISTYSQKVLIALYEKGLEFEPEIVSLMDADARARYREVYPMGKFTRWVRLHACSLKMATSSPNRALSWNTSIRLRNRH